LQLQSAGGDVLFRLKQRCAKVLQGALRAFCRLCIALGTGVATIIFSNIGRIRLAP